MKDIFWCIAGIALHPHMLVSIPAALWALTLAMRAQIVNMRNMNICSGKMHFRVTFVTFGSALNTVFTSLCATVDNGQERGQAHSTW